MLYLNNNIFYDAKTNLALEEIFFNKQDIKEPILLLWQNSNSVIIGKNQLSQSEINQNFIQKNNVEVVRRITGGGSVFHDLGNLNFSIIFNKNENEIVQFQNLIIESINSFKLNSKLLGRNDIQINEFKISGSSANVRKNRVLYHGTILINSNLNILGRVLNPDQEKLKSKGIQSVKSRVKNLNDLTSKEITIEKMKRTLLSHFKNKFVIHDIQLNKDLINQIFELKQIKYSKNSWNYNEKLLNFSKTKRLKCGTISLSYKVKNDKIDNLKIFGDFFSVKNIVNLQNLLNGLKLSNLEEIIKTIDLNNYIIGINNNEFLQLFRGDI